MPAAANIGLLRLFFAHLSNLWVLGSRLKKFIDAAQPLLGANVVEFQVQGWRYSKPDVVDSARCIVLSDNTTLPPLALAGDAFAGPRFEGAVLSGWAAAAALEPLI